MKYDKICVIPELHNKPWVKIEDWGTVPLYTFRSGAFIQIHKYSRKPIFGRGIGMGRTCLGSFFFDYLDDEERSHLIKALPSFVEEFNNVG